MAEKLGQQQVEPEHVLIALLDQPDGLTRPIFGKIGANVNVIRTEVEAVIKTYPQVTGATQRYLSSRLNQIFSQSQKEADSFKDEYISTEHLLLALAEEKSGEAGRILRSHGE